MSLTVTSAVTRSTASTGATTTTGSFTPANSCLLVAVVGTNTAATTATVHTVSGGSLTWTERIHCDAASAAGRSGAVSIWTAPVTAGASMTVTAAGGPDVVSVQVYQATGQHASPIGATGLGGTTTAANTLAVFTSTAANSYAFAALNDWNQTGAPTSSDMTITTYNVAGQISGVSGFKALGAIGAKTVQITTPAAPDAVWAALEILEDPAGATAAVPRQPIVAPSAAVMHAATY